METVNIRKQQIAPGDAGSRLMFKFRSGTHGLIEELGRHRGREGRKECLLCDCECESVSHVLWECPAYSDSRCAFLSQLHDKLGSEFDEFESFGSLEKSSLVLGGELWEENCMSLLDLVKEYIVDVWEIRKARLYGENLNDTQYEPSHSSIENLQGQAGHKGKFDHQVSFSITKPTCSIGVCDSIAVCCGSAHSDGCVVDGENAKAAL